MKQRDIILVPFPFADQSGEKIRPALIISNNKFNQGDDIIVCAITSNIKTSKYSIILKNDNVERGIIYDTSAIKVENIFKIKKSLVIKTIAAINKSLFSKVINIIHDLVASSE